MKFRTILISSLALGMMSAIPAIQAQDEKAPAAPAPEQKPEVQKAERKGPRGGWMSPEVRVAQIDKAVGGLTDDQKAKIKDIFTKAADQMKDLAPEDRREKGREIMQSTHEQVRAVLTADQQTKFDAMPQRGPGGQKKKKAD